MTDILQKIPEPVKLTAQELDQQIFSLRSAIEDVKNKPLDKDGCHELLSLLLQAAVLLEINGENPASFYEEILELPLSEYFEDDTEETLIQQHCRMHLYTMKIRTEENVPEEAPAYLDDHPAGPEENLSLAQTIVWFDRQFLQFVIKMLEVKKKKEKAKSRDVQQLRKELRALFDELRTLRKKTCGLLEDMMTDSGCPWWIDSTYLRCLLEMYTLKDPEEDNTFNHFEECTNKAQQIWTARPNSDTFRLYIRFLAENIDNDWDNEMYHRAARRFGYMQQLIIQTGYMETEPGICTAIDAELLYEIYEIYYRLFNRKWTIESRLKMMRLQAEYAEQLIKRTGRRKPYIDIKCDEYKLRMEPYFISDEEGIRETFEFFQKELEEQWIKTPKGVPNKLIRQITIYMNRLREILNKEGS